MASFPITRTTTPKVKPADDELSFGKVLTDHMFLMDYQEGKGWHSPRIVPYGPLSLDPGPEARTGLRQGVPGEGPHHVLDLQDQILQFVSRLCIDP